jgi:hypothetical protein
MSPLVRDARGCKARRSAANDGYAFGSSRLPHLSGTKLRFATDRRIVNAADAAATVEANDARLVGIGAQANAASISPRSFGWKLRVRDEGPRHADEIRLSRGENLLPFFGRRNA